MAKRFNPPDRHAVLHFLTVNIRDRKRAFSRDDMARAALFLLREHCDHHPAKLIAYVAMPEHLHCIINPRDGQCTAFLAHYKPAVTRAISEIANRQGLRQVLDWLRMPDGHEQLWQESKHDFQLWSERLIWQKIDYLHHNPIKRGLAQQANTYPYSSFRAFHPDMGEPIIPVDDDPWWHDLPLTLD